MTEGNGRDVYKLLTSFLLGVVVTGIMAYFTAQRDVVTRREFNEQNARYEKHFEENARQIEELTKTVAVVTNNVSVLSEDLKLAAQPRR